MPSLSTLKYISLATLTVQNSSLAVVMHYARISSLSTSAGYSSAEAVFITEFLKGVVSLSIALWRIAEVCCVLEGPNPGGQSIVDLTNSPSLLPTSSYPRRSSPVTSSFPGLPSSSLSRRLPPPLLLLLTSSTPYASFLSQTLSKEALKLAPPALLYVLQNNLIYLASSSLDVASFSVLSQVKLLTAAGFSVLLLGKRLSSSQTAALLLLAIGVGIVQLQASATGSSPSSPLNPVKGFTALMLACSTSGLAGVLFERTLKSSSTDLWIRNVQLSSFSILPALLPILADPPSAHFFANFTLWAWLTVAIQVAGGLLTAIVIKYADNILKGFSTSISVVIAFTAGIFLFGYRATPAFVLGGGMVLLATSLYARADRGGSGGTGLGGGSGGIEEEASKGLLRGLETEEERVGGSEKESSNSRRVSGSIERFDDSLRPVARTRSANSLPRLNPMGDYGGADDAR